MPEGAEDREPCPDRTDTLPEERREVGRLPTLLPQQNGRHERSASHAEDAGGDHVWLVTFMQYRFGLFWRQGVQAGTDRESVRPESVTHVTGIYRLKWWTRTSPVGTHSSTGFIKSMA